jgi:class 3 adenylate cyclase
MMGEAQLPKRFRDVIDEQVRVFDQGRSVTVRNTIPDPSDIPLDNQSHWLRIPDAICVYVDMLGSTQLSAETHDKNTAGAYQLYTGSAVRLFHAFEAPYIDVRGDGAFALFDTSQPYRAFAAAVTFKTFARDEFAPRIEKLAGLTVGSHIGVDQRTVLVRRIGLRRAGGRTDRQNEVWAGRPVNMAAKLASLTEHDQLLASARFFSNLKDEHALKTCGCPNNQKVDLWTEMDLTEDKRFDFDKAYSLKSSWCSKHGNEYCEAILSLDK